MRGVSSALETVGIESPTIQSMGRRARTSIRWGRPITASPRSATASTSPSSPWCRCPSDLTSLTKKEIDATNWTGRACGETIARRDAGDRTASGRCACSSAATSTSSRVEDPDRWNGSRTTAPFQTVATIHASAGRTAGMRKPGARRVDDEHALLALGRPRRPPARSATSTAPARSPTSTRRDYRARFNRCPIHEPDAAEA